MNLVNIWLWKEFYINKRYKLNCLTKLGKRLKKQQLTINYKIKILYNKILIIKKFDNLTYKNIMKIHNILIYKNEKISRIMLEFMI